MIGELLGSGRQSILLRKRGIAESRFSFACKEFYLYPSFYHQQTAKIHLPVDFNVMKAKHDREDATTMEIRYFLKIIWSKIITDREMITRLSPYHYWREPVITERFCYGGKNEIHLAFVRVFRLTPICILPILPQFGGCRSWIELPDFSEVHSLTPVLSDREYEKLNMNLLGLLGD